MKTESCIRNPTPLFHYINCACCLWVVTSEIKIIWTYHATWLSSPFRQRGSLRSSTMTHLKAFTACHPAASGNAVEGLDPPTMLDTINRAKDMIATNEIAVPPSPTACHLCFLSHRYGSYCQVGNNAKNTSSSPTRHKGSRLDSSIKLESLLQNFESKSN